MLIIIDKTATEEDVERIKDFLISKNLDIHQSTGMNYVIIGAIGNVSGINTEQIENLKGVQQVVKITDYKKEKRG